VFVNPHQPDDTLGRVLQGKRLDNLKVTCTYACTRLAVKWCTVFVASCYMWVGLLGALHASRA
jgi:hypothetical protein